MIAAIALLGFLCGPVMAQDPGAMVLGEEDQLTEQVDKRIEANEKQALDTDLGLVPDDVEPHAGESPHGKTAHHGATGGNPLEFKKDLAL